MLQKFKIWDAPTRLFHWGLVLAFGFMWLSAEIGGNWLQWHTRCGLLIMALVLFRIVWGFVGSDTARFSQFVKGPKDIKRYLNNQLTVNEQPGHNPLGALMVVALLGGLLLQVVTGLFSPDGNSFLYDGYLNHLVSESTGKFLRQVHGFWFNVLLLLAGVHVATIIAYKFIKKQNLVPPMITGKKEIEGNIPHLRFKSPLLAFVIFLAFAVLGWYISTLGK